MAVEVFLKGRCVRRAILAVVAGLFAFALCAEVPLAPAYTEPVLEISVGTGSTNLVDWLASEGKSLTGLATLKKTGLGTLVVTESISSAFSGDIVIAGGVLSVSRTGMLGADNLGVVYVLPGAQLLAETAKDVECAFNKKTFVISGSGVNEDGAIRKTGDYYATSFLGDLHLAADARYEATANATRIGAVYLHGHSLTVWTAADFQPKSLHGQGQIIQEHGPFNPYSDTVFDEDSPGSLIVKAAASFKVWNLGGYKGGAKWSVVLEPGSSFNIASGFSTDTGYNALKGSVTLQGNLALSRYNKPVSGAMTGYVTGSGGISTDMTDIRLNLTCPTNDFTGGIQFTGDGDSLCAVNGALPRNGGGVSIKNGGISLTTGPAYELPPLEIVGTGIVSSAGMGVVSNGLPYYGNWRQSLEKRGDGTLEYMSLVGSDMLDVQGGTVRFGAFGNPGLYVGVTNFATQAERDSAMSGRTLWVTGISDRIDFAYHKTGYWKNPDGSSMISNAALYTYSGYLWNRSATNETWSFCEELQQDARVYIDDELFIRQIRYDTPVFTNRVMTPGPHRIEVRMSSGNGWIGSSGHNGWDETKGLGVCTWGCSAPALVDGKYDLSNYMPLMDLGDGALLSLATSNDTAYSGLPTFGSVKVAPGTIIDLVGKTLPVSTFEGATTVTNGNLSGMDRWSLTAAAVQSEPLVVYGKVDFAADAVFDVPDLMALPRGSREGYVIMRTSSPLTSVPKSSASLKDNQWALRKGEDGCSLYLCSRLGLLMFVR